MERAALRVGIYGRAGGWPACLYDCRLILFGYRPRRLLRHAGIRWMCFDGEDKTYGALDDQVIEGPLVDLWRVLSGGRELVEKGLIERLADAMRPFVSEEAGQVDESMRRNGVGTIRWTRFAKALSTRSRIGTGRGTSKSRWPVTQIALRLQAPVRCKMV